MVLLTTLHQIPDTQCETPKPYCLFQSVSPELAFRTSAAAGLIVLFHDFDKQAYGREWVFWILPPTLVVKLLCCLKDLRAADEFNVLERIIINDLVNKGLMRKMASGDKVYYHGLNENVAARLLRQLLEIKKE